MESFAEHRERILEFAHDIREMAANMAKDAGRAGSHIGGSFSTIEVFSVLFGGGILKYDPQNPEDEKRDRFIPSKTHCILAHFATLAKAGYITNEDIFSFHDNGGLLCGHPWNPSIGLEFAGGSLGMGISVGIGRALFAKSEGKNYHTFVLLGDGESNEGSVWEALMSAPKFKLDNMTVIIDYNNMQFDGPNDEVMSLAPLKDKLVAFGWETVEVDGHDVEALWNAFCTPHEGKPLAVIAKTIKAHGVPSLENKAESHHSVMSEVDYQYVMSHLKEV